MFHGFTADQISLLVGPMRLFVHLIFAFKEFALELSKFKPKEALVVVVALEGGNVLDSLHDGALDDQFCHFKVLRLV